MRLGELCIEVLQQNDEHHSEVSDLCLSTLFVCGKYCLTLSSHLVKCLEFCFFFYLNFLGDPNPIKLRTLGYISIKCAEPENSLN